MKNVTIYVKSTCPYCKKALLVLNRAGIKPKVFDVSSDPAKRQEMIVLSNGGSTVPQIFFDNEHIGGCDDLVKIEKRGLLDQKLGK